jgi:hypothetical protein
MRGETLPTGGGRGLSARQSVMLTTRLRAALTELADDVK